MQAGLQTTMYRCMFSVFPCAVLLFHCLGHASAKPAVKQGQGFQSRPGFQFSTLAVDVDLDGCNVHLDLDQDLDQDTQIPLYELYTDDRGKTQARRMLTETSVSFYQNQQHDSTFGIVSKRNRNGTVSTTMQGFIIRGDKLYEARSKSHEESAGEAARVKNDSLLFDLDLQEVTQPQQQIDGDYESAEPFVRETTVKDGSYNHGLRQKRQTVTQDVTIDVVAVVDYGIYFKWYNNSNEISEDEKKQDALDFIYQFHAFIFNGVNLRYKSIGGALPYTIHVKLSAIVVATSAGDSPWTETRRQNDSDGRVDTANGYDALDDFRDWAMNTTTLPGYDHLMLFTGYDLVNANGSVTLAGLAYTGTMCSIRRWRSTSIVEELKDLNSVIGFSTHELGHGLSARHDGVSGGCSDDDNYIMSGSGTRPGTIAKQLNDWKFSNCSIKYFDDYIKRTLDSSEQRTCFYTSYNASNEVKDTSTLMPGQVYDADEQCQHILGQSSYLCYGVGNWNLSMVCLNMWCSLGGRRCRRHLAARGTTCGDGMWCIDGQCELNVSTTTVSSSSATTPTTPTITTTTPTTTTPTFTTTTPTTTTTTPTTTTPTTTTTTPTTTTTTPTTTTPITTTTTPTSTTTTPITTTPTTTTTKPTSTTTTPITTTTTPTTTTTTPTTTTTTPITTTPTTMSSLLTSTDDTKKDGSECLSTTPILLVMGCVTSLLIYMEPFVQ